MFMNYRERFECLKLSESFEFVVCANHQIELRCKKCGCTWWKYDDFVRRAKYGKVVCPNCGLTCKYEAPEYEKRIPKPPYVKKGYHTPEAIAAREKLTEKRRKQADEKYRQMFRDLGIDSFDYICFEGKGRFKFKCKRCGVETVKSNAVFQGKQKSMYCKSCGNGKQSRSERADEIICFYTNKHSVKETCEKFGLTTHSLNHLVKARGVSNGRTPSEICKEISKKGNEIQKAQARKRWRIKVESLGFDFVEIDDHKLTVRCRGCDLVFNRSTSNLFQGGPLNCPECKAKEIKQRKALQEAERLKAEEERLIRKADQEAKRAVKRAEREANQNARFNQICVCKVCGQEYTPRQYMDSCGLKLFSNPGYCSKTCKINKARQRGKDYRKRTGKHSSNHFARARKLGLPREKGVTLKNLIQKNGLQCQICGMFCDSTANPKSDLYPSIDHIVPMHKGGGHTWDNVQIAHRICNSNKRDYIGKEWNNGDFKEE